MPNRLLPIKSISTGKLTRSLLGDRISAWIVRKHTHKAAERDFLFSNLLGVARCISL